MGAQLGAEQQPGAQPQGNGAGDATGRAGAAPIVEQGESKGSAETLTLTGCLDRTADGTYQLRNAAGGVPGTELVPGGAKAPAAGLTTTWNLKSRTDLAPHVGHQVQITGRSSAGSSKKKGKDSATTAAPTTTATGARMKVPEENFRSVDVQSLRMISTSCAAVTP
jgi:hypothetical protein